MIHPLAISAPKAPGALLHIIFTFGGREAMQPATLEAWRFFMADSLTRKWLNDLGIDAEKIDSIIAAHTSTVDALLQARTDLDALRRERDTLKTAAGDYEREKERADQAVKDLADFKALTAAKEKAKNIEGAFRKLAKDARIDEKHLDTVVKWAGVEGILNGAVLKDDGTFKGADKLTEQITTAWPDWIVTEGTKGTNPATPPAGNGSGDDLAAFRHAMGLPDPK